MSAAISEQQNALLTICKATADTLRLDVLRVLSRESFGVLELCSIFSTPQSGMSHHLKILSNAGLLETRREGNSIFYRRALVAANDPLFPLTQQLFSAIDQMPLRLDVLQGCEDIHRERAENSRLFFQKNANRLKENQSLIADFGHYNGCLSDLLTNRGLPADSAVIEVGPADSQLLSLLSEQFGSVIAIDNAEEMLNKARTAATGANIQFHLGELQDISGQVDMIVLNMVLHHIPSPIKFFESAAQRLNPGGCLLIADLCPHDQDWARDVCGDLWLGFDPAELDAWATAAGMAVGQDAYLGLRNGFQVQVRLFENPLKP